MKKLLFILLLLPVFVRAQDTGFTKISKQDSVEITETALGYLIALQQLKPDLMKKVMHEKLSKRTLGHDRELDTEFPRPTTYEQMIAFAESWNKKGDKFPANPTNEAVILDAYQKLASVRLVSDNWVEYLHLMKINGEWKIIDLMWQFKDTGRYKD